MHHVALTRIAAPAAEPVTLAETKSFLRIDHAAEDALLGDLIKAARAVAEEHLRRSLVTQSWRLSLEGANACRVPLPRGPVQSIAQASFVSPNGDQTILTGDAYQLCKGPDAIKFLRGAGGARIEIEYVAGYGAAGAVPPAVKQGMLMHIAALYEQREGAPMPDGVIALYAPFREVRL